MQCNHFAASALDHGGDHIALMEGDIGIGLHTLFGLLLAPCGDGYGFGGGRSQGHEAVATVDAQSLGDGTDLMGGIQLAITVAVVICTLLTGVFHATQGVTQVMLIATLAIDQFAEETLANHVHHHQLSAAVAAIFQHHHGSFGALIGMDHLPQLIQGGCATHFDGSILAGFHAIGSDLQMGIPGGGDKHRFQFFHFQHIMIVGKGLGCGLSVALKDAQDLFDQFFLQIANSHHFQIIHLQKCCQQHFRTDAKTNNACFYNSFHFYFSFTSIGVIKGFPNSSTKRTHLTKKA